VRRDQSDDRLIGIEFLRFAAAFGVLVWHYQNFMITGTQDVVYVREAQPLYWLLAPLYAYGNAGVELFWCISGFIFTWKYIEPIRTGGVTFGRFMMLRFSRLYPLHFATLLLVAGLNAAYFSRHGSFFVFPVNDLKHFLLNLGFASQWGFQTDRSFNGPIWSVSVEILVYFLFFGISRVWRGNIWSDIGIAMLASAVYAMLRRYTGIKLEVFGAITFFYIGAATCHGYRTLTGLTARQRHQTTIILAAVILATCALVATRVLKVAGASLAMFPAAILFVQMVIRPRSRRVGAAITGVGNLTYASYLIHFPLQIAIILTLEDVGIAAPDLFYGPWLLPAYLGLVLGLSVAVFHGFERPAQNWLRGLGRRSAVVPNQVRS
jgi:peptidoglycan/LPS O-acetylase OafA/YrhL